MSPLSSLPPISSYSSRSGSGSASAVRESRNTGKANGEAPAETGSQSVRAADENQAVGANRKPAEADASDKKVGGLDEAELKELTELKARDREVRAHEAAHQAVGGQYAGAMSLSYQRGPDGAQYAVGGEVSIDMSPVNGDPQATIEKMRVVRSAAMAPAEPSGQDRAVAAQAMQVMLQAQSELALEQESSESGAEKPVKESEDASSDSGQVEGSRGDTSESLPRAAQLARNAYQDIAGFGPERASPGDGFLPISV
ncbi:MULTISPECIES: putative metalloprotease CJM1_0395 family protein [Marinobacter]|uniref:Metalloprotease CJM1_0395 family protein n=1 Tax=Marinobacter xiaoshiensis TaxID=3073652 RepID=A0ABU2HFN1_9GAMM|nr:MULTISPECIES: putative metalloprotease CJM1_0395 family protein [unclassified Marinobacter]MDS1309361.1 putative metalloprotease CJM1_0395 family protein [Marinobacter sp. F60267]